MFANKTQGSNLKPADAAATASLLVFSFMQGVQKRTARAGTTLGWQRAFNGPCILVGVDLSVPFTIKTWVNIVLYNTVVTSLMLYRCLYVYNTVRRGKKIYVTIFLFFFFYEH